MRRRGSIAIAFAVLATAALVILGFRQYWRMAAERRAAEARAESVRRLRSRVVRLSFAPPDEVARTVSEELASLSTRAASDEADTSPVIVPHVETRSILVQAESDTLERIVRRILALDVALQDAPASEGAR